MTDREMLEAAQAEGFCAALIETDKIPTNPTFREFCKDNKCGQYAVNYSCPPHCGTVEQMHEKLLGMDRALVLMKTWPLESYQDIEAIAAGKRGHNAAELRLFEKLGLEGFCVGSSCCRLCAPCRLPKGEPCPMPQKRYSCMSAYCIDVAKTAELCGLEFAWDPQKMYSYGMIVFRDPS